MKISVVKKPKKGQTVVSMLCKALGGDEPRVVVFVDDESVDTIARISMSSEEARGIARRLLDAAKAAEEKR